MKRANGATGWPGGRLALLLTGVFLVKLLIVLQLKDHPLLQPEAGLDTSAYADLARQVLAGNIGLGPSLYYVSPLYIYFLAAGLWLFKSYTAVRVLQIALGTASVGFVFLAAKEWFGARAAWVAAILAGLTGLFTFYEALILQAAVDGFLTAAALWCLTVGLARRRAALLLLCGVIFGIQTLNRPNILIAAACIAAVLVALRRVRPAVLLVAGLLAGMAPVAMRNIVVAHQWSFVSSHGGLNFYIGNSETATGFYHVVPGIRPTIAGQEEDVRRVAERATGRRLTDAETSGYFFGLAWTWTREHPADAMVLFARKLAYVFVARHIALPQSYPFYAYDARTLLRFLFVGPWLLVPLGLVGLWFAAPARNRADYVVWASFVPAYAVAVAAFFVAERYRLPLLVPLCVGAGAAVDLAWRAWPRRTALSRAQAPGKVRERPRLVAAAFVFVVLFAFANWPYALQDGRWEEGLRLAQRLVILQRFDEADQWVERFEPRGPRPGATHYGVGLQLLQQGETNRALAHLATAERLDPGDPHVEYGLGQALLKADRAKDAIPHLQRGFDGGIELPQGGLDLAVALDAAGDYPAAARVLPRITPPDTEPEAWLKLGRIGMQAQAPEAAEPFFRHAVSLRPDDPGARLQFGLNLLVLRRYEDAARELTEAVRLDPRNPDSLSRLAYCELQLARPADARRHAEAALALAPDDAFTRQLIAAIR